MKKYLLLAITALLMIPICRMADAMILRVNLCGWVAAQKMD